MKIVINNQSPDFSNPPINEVFFGAEFTSKNFDAVHFGNYWQTIKDRFPRVSTHLAIIPQEKLTQPIITDQSSFPRSWFETEDQSRLIQLQEDRFVYNWRQMKAEQTYPHFKVLLPEFVNEFGSFLDWTLNRSEPKLFLGIRRFELTYINHIDENSGWSGPSDNSSILKFADFTSLIGDFDVKGGGIGFQFTEKKSQNDVVVSLKQGLKKNNNKPVLVFELTIRKNFKDPLAEQFAQWFASANEALNQVFISLTTDDAHARWKRSK